MVMDEDTPVVVSDYTANLGIIDLGSKPTQVHRSLVYDSLDQRTTKNTMSNQSCISVASTVDVDNTSAYLKRYADIYVHEDIDCRGITFIKVKEDIIVVKDITAKSPSTFKERNEVVYTILTVLARRQSWRFITTMNCSRITPSNYLMGGRSRRMILI